MSIKNNKSAGFSLIEILISILIMSIGLFGVASLQVLSLRYNQGAYLRSQASLIAIEIIDAMRTNTRAVNPATGSVSLYGDDGAFTVDSSFSEPTPNSCLISVNGCTPAVIATEDIAHWSRHFPYTGNANPTLPEGSSGSVSRVGNIYTVTVNWREMGGKGPEDKNLTTNFFLESP